MTLPNKQDLVDEFVGKPLGALRTPAFVIDRAVFAKNCGRMHANAKEWGAAFRAHIKTHKTTEGTSLQLVSEVDKTGAIIVSTMAEAWHVVDSGLVANGTVKDMLYGLPVAVNKIADLSALREAVLPYDGIVRIIVDHLDQIRFLEEFEKQQSSPKKWSAFIKLDNGTKRAGIRPSSPRLKELVTAVLTSSAVTAYGFYCHSGNAYASTTSHEASSFLSVEVEAVNTAAGMAISIMSELQNAGSQNTPFILSVGSTPTAHAATAETKARLSSVHY